MKESLELFLQYLSNEKRVSPHTVQAYGSDLEQYILFLNNKRGAGNDFKAEQAGKEDIRDYLGKRIQHGMSKRSVSRNLASIRSFYGYLVKTGVLTQDPTAMLISPKPEKRLPHFLNEREMTGVFNSIELDTLAGSRDRAILELFYGTGMRLSELAGLNLIDVDFTAMTVRVRGKGGKERILPLGKCVIRSMIEYLQKRPQFHPKSGENAIFLNPSGKRISVRGIQNLVHKRLQSVSEKEKLSPHLLRHTFATHLLNRGADLESVRELLGHASLSTTQGYTHLTTDHLQQVYRRTHPRSELESETGKFTPTGK